MSTDLQPATDKAKTLREWVQTDEARREIADAVGDVMPSEQFIAHMLVAFRDEKVKQCTDQSKYRALMECAALTMLPTLGQVVLIPYGNEIKAMPQWQGYKAIMERHPDLLEVVGVLVHVNDTFSVNEGSLRHAYDPFNEAREFKGPKDIRGGYCKIVYRDGRPPKYHMVPRKTIEQAQGCAQTQNVWKKWYYEMALKTVYRNAYNRRAVPIDPLVNARLERAVNVDDLNLGNDPMRIASEASQEHLEQARAQRDAVNGDPPFNPPTPEEEAEASQVDPDAIEGVDPTDAQLPLPTSAELRSSYEDRIGEALKIGDLQPIKDDLAADALISDKDIEAVTKQMAAQRVIIRSARGPRTNAKRGEND